MKQIIQSFKSGETILEELPAPQIKKGHVLIQTKRSLVSLGTERMLVEFGKSNLIAKARQQPDKVKMVLDKIKSDGLMPTLEAVFKKLGEPLPLGYCNAGEIIGVGEGVSEFKVGDRVVSNGGHAEIVNVPKNLVAHIPENVSYEEASFTVIGAIGLQGIRLVNPTFGETVVVVGLGLIGLITAEILIANGCQVIGYDFDDKKVQLARESGVEAYNLADGTDPVSTTMGITDGVGADAVIITASTKTNDVISQAANMSRKRGRIVLVGVIGLDISRADFYEKELSFQVSCSYGPGRYDDLYEKRGQDYPLPFVRWTENRNFKSILTAISKQQVKVGRLITEVVNLEDYQKIYGDIGGSKSIASILKYSDEVSLEAKVALKSKDHKAQKDTLAIVGAGNFTKMTVMPILKKINADVKYIVSSGGLSGTHIAQKYEASVSSTSYEDVLQDEDVNAVVITTQHNMHKDMTLQALEKGKHVFVEKPLTLTSQELEEVIEGYEKSGKSVMVGFNRRFSPFMQKAKAVLGNNTDPMNVIINANAGAIPGDHWVHDMKVGGGRIIGEGCHFIDLITFLTGSEVTAVCVNAMGENPEENSDNMSILLKYKNGSNGVVNYFANGHKSYSKERVEVYSKGRVLILDNFRKMKAFGFKGFTGMKSKQDKGHATQFKLYSKFLKEGGKELIPFHEIVNSTKASFAAVESLKSGNWVSI